MTTPKNEQETISSYDRELDQWHYYSDVPKHNRKWADLVDNQMAEMRYCSVMPYDDMMRLEE